MRILLSCLMIFFVSASTFGLGMAPPPLRAVYQLEMFDTFRGTETDGDYDYTQTNGVGGRFTDSRTGASAASLSFQWEDHVTTEEGRTITQNRLIVFSNDFERDENGFTLHVNHDDPNAYFILARTQTETDSQIVKQRVRLRGRLRWVTFLDNPSALAFLDFEAPAWGDRPAVKYQFDLRGRRNS